MSPFGGRLRRIDPLRAITPIAGPIDRRSVDPPRRLLGAGGTPRGATWRRLQVTTSPTERSWSRRLFPVLAALIPLALVILAWAGRDRPSQQASTAASPTTGPVIRTATPPPASVVPTAIPPPLGTRISDGLDVVILLDESGSTTRSDPGRSRVGAAIRAVHFLKNLGAGQQDRVAVVRFGDRAIVTRPLTPVDGGVAQIEAALSAPVPAEVGTGTSFVPALVAARDALGTPAPGRRRAAILFTDGVVEMGETFGQIGAAAADLGQTNLHLVELDAGGIPVSARSGWSGLALKSRSSVTQLSNGQQFELALGRVLVEELGLTWGGQP